MSEKINELIPEILEIIKTIENKNEEIQLNEIAKELKVSINDIEKAIEIAIKNGLIERIDNSFKLTKKGLEVTQTHREKYLHEKYIHSSFLNSITKIFEGKIEDWRKHWHHRHGFDEKSLDEFYEGIRSLEGRIEDILPLTSLKQGEKGIITFMYGGRGLVRRLTEMGLTPGTEVIIVKEAPFHGPIEVCVRGTFLAIGRGMASKIFVKKLKENG
ncbi:MAG: FeoA domain-containing protein [Nitrososphaerota archaeon]